MWCFLGLPGTILHTSEGLLQKPRVETVHHIPATSALNSIHPTIPLTTIFSFLESGRCPIFPQTLMEGLYKNIILCYVLELE